jgi:hypothetical protein
MNPLLERLFRAWTDVDDLSELEDRFAALYTDPVRVNGTIVSPSDLASESQIAASSVLRLACRGTAGC